MPTLASAGIFAQAARLLLRFPAVADTHARAEELLSKAVRAWQWAEANPEDDFWVGHRQREVWAIDEMVVATEAQLGEAEAERSRGLQATEEAPQHHEPTVQCPLAEAGGVCVVKQCEWCGEGDKSGRVQSHDTGF